MLKQWHMKLHFLHLQVKKMVGFDWIVKYMCVKRRGFKILGLYGVTQKEKSFQRWTKITFWWNITAKRWIFSSTLIIYSNQLLVLIMLTKLKRWGSLSTRLYPPNIGWDRTARRRKGQRGRSLMSDAWFFFDNLLITLPGNKHINLKSNCQEEQIECSYTAPLWLQ